MMQTGTTQLTRALRNRTAFALLTILMVASTPGSAFAAGDVALERFEVQLWPDYDKPAVLVMYRARLAADTALPAQVGFRIPAAVGEPHAVAYRGGGDRLLLAEHSREVDGEWATILITSESRDLQLEYYAPILTVEGKRVFSYTWPGDMAVGAFVYGAQQPAAAAAFEVSPPASEQLARAEGLIVHTADLGPVAVGKQVEVRVSYESDGTLSAKPAAAKPASRTARRQNAPRQPASSSAGPPAATGASDADDWLIWLVLALTVAAGAVWVGFAGRR